MYAVSTSTSLLDDVVSLALLRRVRRPPTDVAGRRRQVRSSSRQTGLVPRRRLGLGARRPGTRRPPVLRLGRTGEELRPLDRAGRSVFSSVNVKSCLLTDHFGSVSVFPPAALKETAVKVGARNNPRETMHHIVNDCPIMRFPGSLWSLHQADEDSVSWLGTQSKR